MGAARPTEMPARDNVADAHGALQRASARSAPEDCIAALEQAIDGVMETNQPHLFQTFEALLVRRAFGRCQDNQVRSARLLGITRNTLRTLLKRHGLLSDAAGLDFVAEDKSVVEPSTYEELTPTYSFEN
jgi:sigma-54-specific transcriptional regulator